MTSQAAKSEPKSVAILGATGSIGQNTLDLIRRANQAATGTSHEGPYRVDSLTAGSRVAELAALAHEFRPRQIAVADEAARPSLEDLVSDLDCEVAAGTSGLEEAAAGPSDWVMAAIVGAAGLSPTLQAVRQGKTVVLANKECLVCAGDLFMREVVAAGATLLPADSEHNAIYQVFDFDRPEAIQSITLTASGGPFREATLAQMRRATPEEAVAHPNWSMGAKISVDSATMMNKGLEVIEAYHLFPVEKEQIEVLCHPQSVVHSFVTYKDGSTLAQLGSPDMRTPISYTLAWPDRMAVPVTPLNLGGLGQLTFETPDLSRFPLLKIAQVALQRGGLAPTILNAANEVAVSQFLHRKIGFLDIAEVVERALERSESFDFGGIVLENLEQVMDVDARARSLATELTAKLAVA
ncbi:MAG: 1-deoxy-D-xylulose-5-phosphate reductoisomerase [Alphaproteobacteria bacterium]|nr:MAG: 1-deoxy-D-xylulose-5-phosphate reductoisomerase [Alphaproteobacteria bacterium]